MGGSYTRSTECACTGATLQLLLLGAALLDISRRTQDELRGSKRLWVPALFINFVGPAAYFLFGRRR